MGGQGKRLHVHHCPACQSRDIERASFRGVFERLLLGLAVRRPYRCQNCGRRFYDRPAADGFPRAGA